ncbi:multidrug resistance efflux pump [Mizugakiibacter sediminis]|uniref:Anibiotic ABC transporter n=1 Tax=Mizugakiibacter sediminis TaxID=1475481 RepID=A0A0K8QNW9_9GAMM|nr:HlyD family efflux transporter periplasmic adaptor subunit [Mizugakiibacter sediminis]GAP66411.1 multidrug resistance efflux pump [Mizugakiibacter sediminis]
MEGLFRQEVIEARRGDWLGAIQLAAPLSFRLLAALGLMLAAALLTLLMWGQYTRRERVSGQLVPSAGLLSVASVGAGTLTRVWVHEGQRVQAGDPLVEISGETDSATFGGTRAEIGAQLHRQRARLESDLADQRTLIDQQAAALRTRLRTLRDALAQVDVQLELQRRQAASAQQLLERIQPLREKGYVSAFQVQQQEAAALETRSQAKALERQRLDVRQQIDDAAQQLAQLPLALAARQNETQRAIAEIDQQLAQNEAQRATVLRAPAAATVSTLPAKPGQSVVAGEVLMTLLPQGAALEGMLLVPSRAIGFVRPGDRVVLRYQAYPYQKFGQQYGRVKAVSRSALTPQEIVALTGRQAAEPLYRVAVRLDRDSVAAYGKPERLKPGMAFEADILQERRRLIEWVLEPLYGLRHAWAAPAPAGGQPLCPPDLPVSTCTPNATRRIRSLP